MTPGQARIALGMFMLVSVGVAVNALFLQPEAGLVGRTQAERMSSRAPRSAEQTGTLAEVPPRRGSGPSPEERGLRIARFAADPGKLDPAATGAAEGADAERVRAIQRELRLRGYGPVAVDGAMGLATRAAIMAFEHDQAMALSGEASEALLKRIVFGAVEPANSGQTGKEQMPSPRAAEVIRSVQLGLAALGYEPGQIDGRLQEETQKAIREFEVDHGMVPRGRVSAEVVGRLGEATTAKPASR